MTAADDFADLGNGMFRWEAYDAHSKVDLCASAVVTDGGMFFIDPIRLRQEALDELLAAASAVPAGVILTNENHERDSAEFARRFGVPVIPAVSLPEIGGMRTVPLPGAAPGEAALHRSGSDGGTAIVGDALINLGSTPFTPLPDKYCEDPAELRRSLAQLAELPFERMLFAHGDPIMSGAQARLKAILAR